MISKHSCDFYTLSIFYVEERAMTNMSFNYVYFQNISSNILSDSVNNAAVFQSMQSDNQNLFSMVLPTSGLRGINQLLNQSLTAGSFSQAANLHTCANLMQGLMKRMFTCIQTVMQLMGMNTGNLLLNNQTNTLSFNGFLEANQLQGQGYDNNANPLSGNQNNTPIVLSGGVTDRVAQIANHESTLGINEADGSYKKYGQPSHWCGAFVDWCFNQSTGGKTPWAGENFHYVPNITNWAKNNGVYKSYNASTLMQDAKAGDMIIFRSSGGSESSHVGIISKVYPDGSIETVEGNTSDQCKKRYYQAGDPRIQGFLQAHILEQQGQLIYA